MSKAEDEYLDKTVAILFDMAYEELQEEAMLNSSNTSKTAKK